MVVVCVGGATVGWGAGTKVAGGACTGACGILCLTAIEWENPPLRLTVTATAIITATRIRMGIKMERKSVGLK